MRAPQAAFAGAAALILLLFVLDRTSSVPRYAMSAWALAAIAYGATVYRPKHAYVWALLAAAVVVFQIADASDFASQARPLAPPGVADWLALLGYPIAAAGLLLMARYRTAGKNLAGLLDALIVVAALVFPVWLYLIRPNLARHGRSVAFHVAVAAPPICDLVLLGLLIWLVATAGSRIAALWLLTLGLVGCSLADALQAMQRLGRPYAMPSDVALWLMLSGWICYCLLWGAAALAPSMTAATRPVPAREPDLGLGRLALMFAAMLVTPVVVLERLLRGGHFGGILGPLMSMLVVLLVMGRVSLVLVDQRRARSAEKTLLASGNALMAAGGAGEVAATLTATATRLVGPACRHAVVVVVAEEAGYRVADSRTAESPALTDARSARAGGAGQGAEQPDWYSTLVEVGRVTDGAAEARLPVAALPPALAQRFGGFGDVGVLPLGTEAWRDGLWTAGVLAVSADEQALALLAGPLRILAGQAASTLRRIGLDRELARRDSEAYFQTLVRNTTDAILIVDAAQHVTYASPSASVMFGVDVLPGRALAELIGVGNARELAEAIEAQACEPPICRDWKLTSFEAAAEAAPREVEAMVADLRGDPTVAGFVLTLHDVTTARDLERTVRRHAYYDQLTGLPNRLAFLQSLDDALKMAGPGTSVTVVLLDLDHFREINDAHGRELGDEILRTTADLISAGLFPGDVAGRTGGDEFAVLRVRRPPEHPRLPLGLPGESATFHVGPATIGTSGAVAANTPDSTAASLLADAEMTLHAAKAGGRPRSWRIYEPALRTEFAATAARRSGLERAVADREFDLRYQPIVWLEDLCLAGFETLVRWPQPDGSILTPDEFIPLAEATGEILPLGRWILHTATAQAAAWNRTRAAQGLPPIRVTVNASAHELRAPDFPGSVQTALADSGLHPDHLVLEITESALIRHADAAVANLHAVARHGVRIALDDFGTGYSSLGYLHDLPVTGLKIDKLFVAGARDSVRQAALVRGIIGIGTSLGLNIVAEGLETAELATLLTTMGANLGQGYLFGHPEPAARAEAWALDGGPLWPEAMHVNGPSGASGAVGPNST